MSKSIALFLPVLVLCAAVHAASFNVREFGAKADKTVNDQAAIQAAVDACAQAGGGTICFPPGEYLSGAIRLKSHVAVHLEAGAILWSSPDPAHYDNPGRGILFNAAQAEDISITGPGVLHGQGETDLGRRPGVKDERPAFRTGILLFEECRDITLRQLTILYSDAWTLHLKQCDTVLIDGVTIRNNFYRVNSDGIDPNSCKNVRIANCHITAGDDCIVLKSTTEAPCENVVVTNCILESIATALKLGTESLGDFRDVHFSNCVIRNASVGLGFYLKDGATMERVTFSNISIEEADPVAVGHVVYPIFMDIERRHPDSPVGRIRDVIFRDIQVRGGSGALIQGMPESPIENLTLQNITFRVDRADTYDGRKKAVGGRRTTRDERDTLFAQAPAYLTLAHIQGATVDNVRVTIEEPVFRQFPRSALSLYHAKDSLLRALRRTPKPQGSDPPVIELHETSAVTLVLNNGPES